MIVHFVCIMLNCSRGHFHFKTVFKNFVGFFFSSLTILIFRALVEHLKNPILCTFWNFLTKKLSATLSNLVYISDKYFQILGWFAEYGSHEIILKGGFLG